MKRKNQPKRVFHYTTMLHLNEIRRTGAILPATAFVPRGQRPAVWLTTSGIWEETANKALGGSNGQIHGLDREGTHLWFDGLVRIEVDPDSAPLRWRDFAEQSGTSHGALRILARKAQEQGSNLSEWRMSFEPIDSSRWRSVEQWDGTRWTECDLTDAPVDLPDDLRPRNPEAPVGQISASWQPTPQTFSPPAVSGCHAVTS